MIILIWYSPLLKYFISVIIFERQSAGKRKNQVLGFNLLPRKATAGRSKRVIGRKLKRLSSRVGEMYLISKVQ